MGAQNRRFLIVGGGKMGEAILKGWINSQSQPADVIGAADVAVAEPSTERRAQLVADHGVVCAASAADAVAAGFEPDVVVLAVKPQVMTSVLADMVQVEAFQGGASGPLFVSIAAGLPTSALEASLPAGASLVRVMPNMPLAIGAGASGVCAGANATSDQVDYVAALFGCLGRAVVVAEHDMDVVCALSGSGPAYVAAMIEALRDAAASEGLSAELAEALALQTVLGTARLIDETGADVGATRESICSPGGTTIAALDAMNAAGFEHVFAEGVHAAVQRSKELAQCIS